MANLRGIKLTNFRIHKDTTIPQIDDLLVLVGKNDTGKSSILKAFDIFFNGDANGDNKVALRKDDVSFGQNPDKLNLKVDFVQGVSIVVSFNESKEPNYELINPDNLDIDDNYKQSFIYKFFPAEGSYDESIGDRRIGDLLDSKRGSANYTLKKFVEKWDVVLQEYKNSSRPISEHGTGVRRLCSLFNFLSEKVVKMKTEENNLVIAIEEPEISLYPNQQRLLMQALLEIRNLLDCQLLISTHSSIVVQELKMVSELNNDEPEENDEPKEEFDTVVILNRIKDKSGSEISDKIEVDTEVLKNSVIKNYVSLNEVNYLAFEEASIEYHIELFSYIQNRLIEKYTDPENKEFENKWNDEIIKKSEDKEHSSPKDILGVDLWLKKHGCKEETYYRGAKPQRHSLCVCVRNNIDHPYIIDLKKATKQQKMAYECNKCFDDLETRKKSIDFMIEVLRKDNWEWPWVDAEKATPKKR